MFAKCNTKLIFAEKKTFHGDNFVEIFYGAKKYLLSLNVATVTVTDF